MRTLLMTVALILAGTQTPSQTTEGVIEGRVLRTGSLEPLPGVQITLVSTPTTFEPNLSAEAEAFANGISRMTGAGDALYRRVGRSIDDNNAAIEAWQLRGSSVIGPRTSELTDSSGHFSFKNLAPGKYTLIAQREGFFGSPATGVEAATTSVTLQPNHPGEVTELLLTKGGVIGGTVRDVNGQPVHAIDVVAYRARYSNGRKTWSTANANRTDDRGEYRIFWLVPGEYFVGVTSLNGSYVGTPNYTPGSRPPNSWGGSTFFPGTTDPANAVPIVLKEGGEMTSIDLNVHPPPRSTFKISGTAVNPYARPNATTGTVDRTLSAFVLSPREPGVLDTMTPPQVQNAIPVGARPNGEFEIQNVRPGAYDLYTLYVDTLPPPVAELGAPKSLTRFLTSRTAVDVRTDDVTGLHPSVTPGLTLSGSVVARGHSAQPIKMESIRILLQPLDTLPPPFAAVIGGLQPDASGNFTAENVPEARYTFQVSGMPNTAYVAEIRQGGVSVFDNGVVLNGAANRVQIIVDRDGVTIEGFVQTRNRKPAANATVVLVPLASRRKNALMFKNATADDSGHFTIHGVPPGEYTVFAWDSVLPTAWQNTEFLSKYQDRGSPLNVAPLSHPSIELESIATEADR